MKEHFAIMLVILITLLGCEKKENTYPKLEGEMKKLAGTWVWERTEANHIDVDVTTVVKTPANTGINFSIEFMKDSGYILYRKEETGEKGVFIVKPMGDELSPDGFLLQLKGLGSEHFETFTSITSDTTMYMTNFMAFEGLSGGVAYFKRQ